MACGGHASDAGIKRWTTFRQVSRTSCRAHATHRQKVQHFPAEDISRRHFCGRGRLRRAHNACTDVQRHPGRNHSARHTPRMLPRHLVPRLDYAYNMIGRECLTTHMEFQRRLRGGRSLGAGEDEMRLSKVRPSRLRFEDHLLRAPDSSSIRP